MHSPRYKSKHYITKIVLSVLVRRLAANRVFGFHLGGDFGFQPVHPRGGRPILLRSKNKMDKTFCPPPPDADKNRTNKIYSPLEAE